MRREPAPRCWRLDLRKAHTRQALADAVVQLLYQRVGDQLTGTGTGPGDLGAGLYGVRTSVLCHRVDLAGKGETGHQQPDGREGGPRRGT